MEALIFAAGLGTRMRPLTDDRPKALIEVAGKTLLEWNIIKLRDSGFDRIVINVHHFVDQIVDFIESHAGFGVEIVLSIEKEEPLETGGGVKYALKQGLLDGIFLIHNVDILSNIDLSSFYKKHEATSLATLLVNRRETSRYLLFDDDMRLAGWTNVATGEVKSPYGAIDPTKYHKYAFSGIHTFNADFAGDLMERQGDSFSIIDLYLSAAADMEIKGVTFPEMKLVDVGRPEAIKEAEKFLLMTQ